MSRLLGFIPARGGSVRLPGKNALEIAGKSLIVRTVEAALASELLDEVAFSSDKKDYLRLAASAGLATPYRRPARLGAADTTTLDVVLDYLDWRSAQGLPEVTHVLVLQPTSPFRDTADIDRAIRFWRDSGRKSLVSAAPAGPSLGYVVLRTEEGGNLACMSDIPGGEVFVLDGEFFLTPVRMLREERQFWNADSALLVRDQPRPHDIDTREDFLAAQAMIERRALDGDA